MIHEPGHPEPWIIALSEAPTTYRAFDYGLRWGIEAMVSHFKTRGCSLEDSRIRVPERLDHLVLVMALALYWAVFTGMHPLKKTSRATAAKLRQNNLLVLHQRHPTNSDQSSTTLDATNPLEYLGKLTRGEGGRSFGIARHGHPVLAIEGSITAIPTTSQTAPFN